MAEIRNQSSHEAMTWRRKTWPKYFELVLSGEKQFELRVNDFNVAKGDVLVLEEWDPATQQYTGRKISKTVSYVLDFKLDDFGQKKVIEEKGFHIIQFEK